RLYGVQVSHEFGARIVVAFEGHVHQLERGFLDRQEAQRSREAVGECSFGSKAPGLPESEGRIVLESGIGVFFPAIWKSQTKVVLADTIDRPVEYRFKLVLLQRQSLARFRR